MSLESQYPSVPQEMLTQKEQALEYAKENSISRVEKIFFSDTVDSHDEEQIKLLPFQTPEGQQAREALLSPLPQIKEGLKKLGKTIPQDKELIAAVNEARKDRYIMAIKMEKSDGDGEYKIEGQKGRYVPQMKLPPLDIHANARQEWEILMRNTLTGKIDTDSDQAKESLLNCKIPDQYTDVFSYKPGTEGANAIVTLKSRITSQLAA